MGDLMTEVAPSELASPAEKNPDLCRECGGLCCCLYLANDEDGDYIGEGWLPEYIALWEDRLTASGALRVTRDGYRAGEADVAPLHDPRISHRSDAAGAAYRASLPGWVDVRKCVFCHPESGCLLPRKHRAPICNEWFCEQWEER
jgi:hypothetical protein